MTILIIIYGKNQRVKKKYKILQESGNLFVTNKSISAAITVKAI